MGKRCPRDGCRLSRFLPGRNATGLERPQLAFSCKRPQRTQARPPFDLAVRGKLAQQAPDPHTSPWSTDALFAERISAGGLDSTCRRTCQNFLASAAPSIWLSSHGAYRGLSLVPGSPSCFETVIAPGDGRWVGVSADGHRLQAVLYVSTPMRARYGLPGRLGSARPVEQQASSHMDQRPPGFLLGDGPPAG